MSAPLAYLAVVAIWATTPLAIKMSNHGLSPFAAVAARMCLATLVACVLVALVFSRSGLKRQNWPVYLAASISLFPNMPLLYWAADYIPSGLISVLFALAPFSMGVMSMLILGENPFTRFKLLGLLIALAGLALVSRDQLMAGGDAWLGVVLVLSSTVLFSFSNVLLKKMNRAIDAFEQTLGALAFSLPGLLLSWWIFDGQAPTVIDKTSLMAVIYLAVVGSLIGFFAFYYVLNHLSVEAVALVPLITPVLALSLGGWLASEVISAEIIAGTIMVLGGLALYELYPLVFAGKLRLPGSALATKSPVKTTA